MPDAALRPCSGDPRCSELTHGGPCEKHRRSRRRASDQRRGGARARGYTARWEEYSRYRLAAHPLCVRCLAKGKTQAGQVTDHIEPHRGDERLFWSPDNHQTLCKACHDRKTATEDGGGGFGRRRGA